MRVGIGHEPCLQFGDARRLYREAGCCAMAAVPDEKVRVALQERGHVEFRDRAARGMALAVADLHDDRRSCELLDEPRRAEAHDARGDLRTGRDDEGGLPVRGGDRSAEQVERLDGVVPPSAVQFFEMVRERLGLGERRREQQVQRDACVLHAAGCVQPRAQLPPDGIHVDARGVFHPRYGEERSQAGSRRPRERIEAETHQVAVLGEHRREVADVAKGDERSVLLGLVGPPKAVVQVMDDLVGDADRSGLRAVGDVVQPRVHDRQRVRQRLRDRVVVDDYHVYAESVRLRDLRDGGGAGVGGDQ